jgi:hypothetical protein
MGDGGTFGNEDKVGNASGLHATSGLGPTHVDLEHWALAVDFDMRDIDGALHGDLGMKEGHTPTSKKKFGKPKN